MAEYCKKCGALLTVGLVYCVNCGEPVANIDEGPDTVIRHPLDTDQPQVIAPTAPPDQRSMVPLVIASIAVACAVIAIAALFYVLGHQAAIRQVETVNANANAVTPNTNPTLSPTPVPSPTPLSVVQTDNSGPIACTSNEKAQLHDDCDTKDCDTDASTVAFGISAGTDVTKLGVSKQGGKYRWEKISVAGRETWIASTKLDCTPGANPADVGTPSPRPTTGDRSANRIATDPWRGIPTDVRAICNDGTYSYTGTHIFQCVMHRGVRVRR